MRGDGSWHGGCNVKLSFITVMQFILYIVTSIQMDVFQCSHEWHYNNKVQWNRLNA